MPAFVPDLSVILAFGLASFVLAISPGPDMALFISRTINYGRPHGVAAMSGAITGILFHALLAAFGVSLLLIALPTAFSPSRSSVRFICCFLLFRLYDRVAASRF